jgi:hypothetical protein
MIYTCYEMIRDCRADKGAGWSYFLRHYVPVLRRLLAHYFPERAADPELLDRVLVALRRPESSLFASMEPAPERNFVAELRQKLLEAVEADRASAGAGIAIDLDTLSSALQSLTMVERQAAWFETMRYDSADTARMLRMDPNTVEKIRNTGAELIRGSVDSWRRTLLADNGPLLGPAAAARATPDCFPARAFFDMIDGRATWLRREQMERHVLACWHCLDHFCRLLEVVDLLRGAQPLTEEETEPYKKLLGIKADKATVWSRIF